MFSRVSVEFEFRVVFGSREQVPCTFCQKREKGCNVLEPDILILKCYIVSKVKFQNNLETVDIPLFGDSEFATYLIVLCLLIIQKDVSASWRMFVLVYCAWCFDYFTCLPAGSLIYQTMSCQ